MTTIERSIKEANTLTLPKPGKAYKGDLLRVGDDPKTVKGEAQGVKTAIMYLAPHDIAWAGRTVCGGSTKLCRKACLYSSGKGKLNTVQQARINKTLAWWNNREGFIRQLVSEIAIHEIKCKRDGFIPAVRLNGTSDIAWESVAPELFSDFPEVIMYDYTKIGPRMTKQLPSNYSLTYSRSEDTTLDTIEKLLTLGKNVAGVCNAKPKEEKPLFWNGWPCIDGDKSDVRFVDPKGVIVLLSAKGDARKDCSGFVVQL